MTEINDAQLLAEFDQFLLLDRGLSELTCKAYLEDMHRFLFWRLSAIDKQFANNAKSGIKIQASLQKHLKHSQILLTTDRCLTFEIFIGEKNHQLFKKKAQYRQTTNEFSQPSTSFNCFETIF